MMERMLLPSQAYCNKQQLPLCFALTHSFVSETLPVCFTNVCVCFFCVCVCLSSRGIFYQGYYCSRCGTGAHKECLEVITICKISRCSL